jgi:preprotein translocase subunit SecD
VAPPSVSSQPKPLRLLSALLVLIVGLSVWAFWPGTDSSIKLGLDLQGGTQVILVPTPVVEGAEITDEQLSQAVEIIRARVDGLGVAEAEVTTQGTGSGSAIVVSVPGTNQDRVVDLVQRTALLDFRPVWTLANPGAETLPLNPDGTTPAPLPAPELPVQADENSPEFQTEAAALDCTIPENYAGGSPDNPELWLAACEQAGQVKYILEPAFIKGINVTGAEAVLPTNGLGWVVSLDFDSEGAGALADASTTLSALPECGAGASPCNAFAIVLDGVVVSAPRFNEPIIGGSAQIEGNFTAEQARDLANVLKYGALPVKLEPVDVTSISATVGSDQLRAGIIAGLLGLALVILYLLFYYRALGIVAALSLVIAAALSYTLFVVLSKSIGLTITLAGVAGAIVAIGITADSFIVYFERIRDEIREGRSLRQACDTGWIRARRTLLAADFISILAAVVLYLLSVGSVRGFAVVLGLTTIIDVIIAFWFTHPLTVLIGRTKWMQRGSKLTGLDPERLGGASLIGAISGQSRRRRREEVTS